MKWYKTVRKAAEAEQTIEKSRFIAYVSPAQTREEAEAFIAAVRKKHKDATHNVPAMVLGEQQQIQWASDDGEPQGTSGAPMVQMLVREGITNVVIVVTRYFGGIKLGTGGLLRAYTSSAKLGLEAAGICEVKEMCQLSYETDYGALAKLQKAQGAFTIADIAYTDVVTLQLYCTPEAEAEVMRLLADLTAGKGRILRQEKCLVKT